MPDQLPVPYRPAQPAARVVPGTVTDPGVYYRYSYRTPSTPVPPLSSPVRRANPVGRSADFISRNSGTFRNMANVPRGIPRFLGNRPLLFVFWLTAMVLMASDEWKNGYKFPRPPRLWWTSTTFFILFLVSQADVMVPLCNALGGGFVVSLLYENVSGNSLSLFGVSLTGNSNTPSSSGALQPNQNIGQSVSQTLQNNMPVAPGVVAPNQNIGASVSQTLLNNMPTG